MLLPKIEENKIKFIKRKIIPQCVAKFSWVRVTGGEPRGDGDQWPSQSQLFIVFCKVVELIHKNT